MSKTDEQIYVPAGRASDGPAWMATVGTNLETSQFDGKETLCAPADPEFQRWLQAIEDIRGANCE